MATQGTLHDAFIEELRDTFDAEKQALRALPRIAKAASSPDLRAAFEQHVAESRQQVERLNRVFEILGQRPRGKHCDGMAGILEEAKSAMEEDAEDVTMDALLIAASQRVEHYEMAAYGTLVAWANAMGLSEAAELLQETLEEEKATDEKLTTLAEGGINQQAAALMQGGGMDDEEDEEEEEQQQEEAPAPRRGAAKKTAGRGAAKAAKTTGARKTASKQTGARKR